MSEETSSQDSINTDNAEEHGLETVTTPEGERYFLNPGNGMMYPRDKIEINQQHIELNLDTWRDIGCPSIWEVWRKFKRSKENIERFSKLYR